MRDGWTVPQYRELVELLGWTDLEERNGARLLLGKMPGSNRSVYVHSDFGVDGTTSLMRQILSRLQALSPDCNPEITSAWIREGWNVSVVVHWPESPTRFYDPDCWEQRSHSFWNALAMAGMEAIKGVQEGLTE